MNQDRFHKFVQFHILKAIKFIHVICHDTPLPRYAFIKGSPSFHLRLHVHRSDSRPSSLNVSHWNVSTHWRQRGGGHPGRCSALIALTMLPTVSCNTAALHFQLQQNTATQNESPVFIRRNIIKRDVYNCRESSG